MNGSITKRGKHSWRIAVDLGRDENGKRQRRFETVNGTKAEAQRKLRELVSTVENGLPVDTTKATVGEFMQQWLLDYAETNTCARTVEGYTGNIRRYITPKLGSIPLAKLTPQQIQSLYAYMLKKGLSPQTILHTHRVLREALSHAVKWGLIIRNACDAVDPPKPRRTQVKTLDAASIQKLFKATSRSPYGAVFYIALYTGMRRGEILGLRWHDINLQNKAISVNQTVTKLAGKALTINDPKTPYSRRLVSLPPSAAAMLSGLKIKRMEQLEMAGIAWDEFAFVFCNADGGPLSPDTVSHAFPKALTKAGLPHIRFHDLRHTHATLMLKQGVHPKIVSERLGHASINITLDTYSHVMPGMQENAALIFEESLKTANSI